MLLYDKMINWWLDKGLAGFRIDAIINIKKALPLRSYPADRADGLCSIHEMLDRAQGIGDFLNEMAENTFRPHNAFTVGEVFNAKQEDLPKIIGDNGYFSTMFDFAELMAGSSPRGWYDHRLVTAEEYKALAFESQKSVEEFGFLSTLIENHDEPRGVSHYIPAEDLSTASKKMIGGINFMLRGLPFIYQGQEIGMENFHYESIEEADDVSALGEYQVALDAGLTPEEALKAIDDYSRDHAPLLLVIGNFQKDAQTMLLPGNIKKVLINTMDQQNTTGALTTLMKGEKLHLEGYQYLVLDME